MVPVVLRSEQQVLLSDPSNLLQVELNGVTLRILPTVRVIRLKIGVLFLPKTLMISRSVPPTRRKRLKWLCLSASLLLLPVRRLVVSTLPIRQCSTLRCRVYRRELVRPWSSAVPNPVQC